MPTESPPTYVRYFAGAYVFRGCAPFDVLGISLKPILSASEEDGHKVDPRYVAGWKPYVVFPCGLVENRDDYLVSFGINDWQSAVAIMPKSSFRLVKPDGSEAAARCFRRANGTRAVSIYIPNGQSKILHWIVPVPGPACSAGEGYIKVNSQRDAEELLELEDVAEISEAEYGVAVSRMSRTSLVGR